MNDLSDQLSSSSGSWLLTPGFSPISHFYRFDGIGSLRNLENSSRGIVASSVFDAYGLQQNRVTLASAYGFIGEEGVRGEKGLAPGTLVPQNMRARMYDPLTGRFTSRDPS